jgi:hypothetical protein
MSLSNTGKRYSEETTTPEYLTVGIIWNSYATIKEKSNDLGAESACPTMG